MQPAALSFDLHASSDAEHAAARDAVHEAWLVHACDAIECFARELPVPEHLLPLAAFAIHSAAEHVRQRHPTAEPDFAAVDPARLVRMLVRSTPYAFEDTLAALACFYEHWARTRRIDPRRGRFVASYFTTLLELHALHGAHPSRAVLRASNPFALRLSNACARAQAALSSR